MFIGYNIETTVEKLIKESKPNRKSLKVTEELVTPSFFRPRIEASEVDSWQTDYKDITFSSYYYKDGNYYVDVSYKGNAVAKPLKLGKTLPEYATIHVRDVKFDDIFYDQARLGLEMMLTPKTAVDAFLNQYGDNLITEFQVVSDFLDKFDPWTHTAAVYEGDYVAFIRAHYRTGFMKPDNITHSTIVPASSDRPKW